MPLLLRLGADAHWLLFNTHHIVTDHWSNSIFSRELAALYGAFRGGLAAPLTALPLQYADFAVWQREWLQGPVLERHLDYWRRALADLPALELPFDRPRPAVASARGGRVRFTIDPTLTSALKALGLREGATFYMTLLAAFEVLLMRYSGQDDIAVGTPIAGRSRPELEGTDRLFRQHARHARRPLRQSDVRRAAAAHARGRDRRLRPSGPAVREAGRRARTRSRDPRRNPIFQVMFALQNGPRPHAERCAASRSPRSPRSREPRRNSTSRSTSAEAASR